MRKANKEEAPDKVALMLKEVNQAYDELSQHIERNELEAYLDEDTIKGDMVDEDENITPEQVAMLGGYSVVYQLKKQLEKIASGKGKQPHFVTVEVRDGKTTIKGGAVPQEVLDSLKDVIEAVKEIKGKKK